MTVRRANAITIHCTDRRRSRAFYRDALGAEDLPGDDPMTCPWLRLGDLTLTLLQNTRDGSPVGFSQHAMLTLLLWVDDLQGAFERAVEHGARVVEAPDDGGTMFLIADPDGLLIEVCHDLDS